MPLPRLLSVVTVELLVGCRRTVITVGGALAGFLYALVASVQPRNRPTA